MFAPALNQSRRLWVWLTNEMQCNARKSFALSFPQIPVIHCARHGAGRETSLSSAFDAARRMIAAMVDGRSADDIARQSQPDNTTPLKPWIRPAKPENIP